MVSQEYSEAISETLDILKHTKKDDVNKISKKFMDFLESNKSNTYKSNLDFSKRIKDMNLNPKTIGILSIINKKFWCNDEQRKNFELRLKQNEAKFQQELREKYDPQKIFENKNKVTENKIPNSEYVTIIKHEEKSFLKSIIDKIKNFFNKR